MENKRVFVLMFLAILAILIFDLFTPVKEASFKPLYAINEKILNRIDSLDSIIKTQLDSIKVLESKKTYYINRYYYDTSKVSNIYSTDTLRHFIRIQLDSLSSQNSNKR